MALKRLCNETPANEQGRPAGSLFSTRRHAPPASPRDHHRRQPPLGAIPRPIVSAGYEAGADTLRRRVRDARQLGIEQLTVYTLSTENLSRSAHEIAALTSILATRIADESHDLTSEGICVRFIGDHRPLPRALIEQMVRIQRLTASNGAMTLFLAINYGARAEILNAARRYSGGGEQAFRRLLYAPEMRDPELIIRTGGEQRLSNFLLWQAAHSELHFRDELWPDFSRQALEQTLAEFRDRNRHTKRP
jgi:undecaprenyl diphosphate synthase